MKHIPALFAALIMTGIVGLAMLGIGANALFNQNTAPTLNSAPSRQQLGQQCGKFDISSPAAAVRISEYQAREQQYQSQLQSLQQQASRGGSSRCKSCSRYWGSSRHRGDRHSRRRYDPDPSEVVR